MFESTWGILLELIGILGPVLFRGSETTMVFLGGIAGVGSAASPEAVFKSAGVYR